MGAPASEGQAFQTRGSWRVRAARASVKADRQDKPRNTYRLPTRCQLQPAVESTGRHLICCCGNWGAGQVGPGEPENHRAQDPAPVFPGPPTPTAQWGL